MLVARRSYAPARFVLNARFMVFLFPNRVLSHLMIRSCMALWISSIVSASWKEICDLQEGPRLRSVTSIIDFPNNWLHATFVVNWMHLIPFGFDLFLISTQVFLIMSFFVNPIAVEEIPELESAFRWHDIPLSSAFFVLSWVGSFSMGLHFQLKAGTNQLIHVK